MTPVFQTIHQHRNGNCFQACVASIFDLPIKAVPHFMENSAGDKWTQEQWDAVRKFGEDNGTQACWIDNPEEPELVKMLHESDLYYIGIGLSFAGDWGHCVVMHKGQNVHDPAGPTGKFLRSEPWTFVVFEPGRTRGGTKGGRE